MLSLQSTTNDVGAGLGIREAVTWGFLSAVGYYVLTAIHSILFGPNRYIPGP